MDIQTLTRFFGWCSILNGGLLIFSALICAFCGDWVYKAHSKWFPMSRDAFNVVIYSFLGLMKILFIVLNLVPDLALSIVG